MFKDVKVDDKLFSSIFGWGVVVEKNKGKYSIRMEFSEKKMVYFISNGKMYETDMYPTLFWDEIKFDIPKKPLPKLEVDTKVLVWDKEGDIKAKRHFKGFTEHGEIICFPNGTTSWSTLPCNEIVWGYWELAKENTEANND